MTTNKHQETGQISPTENAGQAVSKSVGTLTTDITDCGLFIEVFNLFSVLYGASLKHSNKLWATLRQLVLGLCEFSVTKCFIFHNFYKPSCFAHGMKEVSL